MNHVPLLVLALLTACTTVRDDSRRTVHWLDASLTPESNGARMALLPLAIPVGLGGLAVDTAVVNPACAVDDAWGDTVELLWTSREESALRRALFTPLAALATPFVFGSDWVWRCVVPTEPRRDHDADEEVAK
jgi:hypothetical protein